MAAKRMADIDAGMEEAIPDDPRGVPRVSIFSSTIGIEVLTSGSSIWVVAISAACSALRIAICSSVQPCSRNCSSVHITYAQTEVIYRYWCSDLTTSVCPLYRYLTRRYRCVRNSRKGVAWVRSQQPYAMVLSIAINSKFSFPI